ncbi:MAG: Do family serine endopeptidase [Prolixibacteraceae bacterium]|nr:Do family serine endopeptidase [Prolixibacteraceae bacterium]
MKKIQNIIFSVIIAVVGGFTAIYIYTNFLEKPQIVTIENPKQVQYASMNNPSGGIDLTFAAEGSVKAVVHIQTQYQQQQQQQQQQSYQGGGNPFFDFFFGDPYQQQEPRIQKASGSGVIISADGYIVTNNHVIENSDDIKIILNDNREYDAVLIGTDPSTDIALLKIEAENLPFINWGNSDNLKLGEWVLAVGNPFNLTSTVTAGIVSAKARGIGIIGGQLPIESFIQTDAAVNPGNSGGALVNTNGDLVGINTAIASRTGSYSGYSFAVPASIVQKVVGDLKQFGEVQRALLGVSIRTVDADLAEEESLDQIKGVFIAAVSEEGAAKEAGIEKGDVVIAIDNIPVNTSSELQEQIGKHRPGDKIEVLIKRKNKEKLFVTTLRNTRGGTGIIKNSLTVLGAELEKIDEKIKNKLQVRNGLIINKLSKGKLKDAGIREGFIITHVNKRAVDSVEDIKEVLKIAKRGVLVEGLYKNGEEAYYVFGIE